MIRLVEEHARQRLLAVADRHPLMGPRVRTQLAVYGLDLDHLQLWLVQDETEQHTGAIMRAHGVLSLIGGGDPEELGAFLNRLGGFRYLECQPEIQLLLEAHLALPGYWEQAPTMVYRGGFSGQADMGVEGNPSLRDVFDLIARSGTVMAQYDTWMSWYPHVSHVVRHGLGFVAALYRENRAVATGGVFTTGNGYGVIGSVTTLPEERGRGCAGTIVRYLCDRCQERRLTPVLYCAEEALANYYGALGFEPLGRWAQMTVRQSGE